MEHKPVGSQRRIDWTLPVLMAADCSPCTYCGEPWCAACDEHYSDCEHPGPTSEVEEEE